MSGRIRMKPVTVRSVLPETFDVPFSEESKIHDMMIKQGGAEYEYNGC